MMVNDEPKVSANGRYNITETCRKLGIHRNTLLKYTKLGVIKCGIRRSTAKRFYSGSEIVRFWKSQI